MPTGYIIVRARETGRKFADMLLQKQAEGVRVNLIYVSADAKRAERLRERPREATGFGEVLKVAPRRMICDFAERE